MAASAEACPSLQCYQTKTAGSKSRFLEMELQIMEGEFQKCRKPGRTARKALAESIGVSNARINNWFQNRRAREKREKIISDYEAKQRLERIGDEIEDGTGGGCSYQLNSTAFDALVSNEVMKPKQLTGAFGAFGARSENAGSDPAGESLGLCQVGELQLISTMFLPTQKEIADSNVDFASDVLSVQFNKYSPWQDSTLSTDAPILMLHMGAKVPNQQLFNECMGPESSHQDTHNYEELLPVSVGDGRGHSHAIGPRGWAASMVSSRTQSAHVKEIVATPPSPFNFGTNDDSMLERRLSPDASPPTSDTPISLQRQGTMDAAVSSLCPIDSKHASPEIGISSSFISTAPVSDFVKGVFYSGLGYDNSVFQETSMVPGVWGQISGVEMTF